MKTTYFYLVFVLFFCTITHSQEKYTANNKGKFYIFWGGNRDSYSKSDIRFQGDNYDFTVQDVKANDKPKGWHVDFINPGRMTIPQTNFRMGYFLNDKYNISIGFDHMKYVVTQNQIATVNGVINLPASEAGFIHNGTYNNRAVALTEDFLEFEHTDGLNYVNTELSRVDDISGVFGIKNTDKFQVNVTEGVGVGFLFPRTDATVLSKDRHDYFHVSGFGVSAKAGLNFTFYKHFFIQTELKGGYIEMNDIEATFDKGDKTSQKFLFFQSIVAFGGIFRL